MAIPNNSATPNSTNPSPHTASVNNFFILGEKIQATELQVAMNRYALVSNSERPGYTESALYAKIVAANGRMTAYAKQLRKQRLDLILTNRENEPWVRELFRMKREKEEANFKEKLVPDSATAWFGEKPKDTARDVSVEEFDSLMKELSLGKDKEGHWCQK